MFLRGVDPETGEQRGLTYETKNKLGERMIKKRPEVDMMADAQNRCLKILSSFGLSPSDSVRVKVKPKEKKVNPFATLGQKAQG